MLKVAEKADSPEDTSYLNPVVLKNVPLRYTGEQALHISLRRP